MSNDNSISPYRDQCVEALQCVDELKKLPHPITPDNLRKIQELLIAVEGIYLYLEKESYKLRIDRLKLEDDNNDLNNKRSKINEERRKFEGERIKFAQEREEVGTRVATQRDAHAAELKNVVDLYNINLQRQAARIHTLEAQLQAVQPQAPSDGQEVVFWA